MRREGFKSDIPHETCWLFALSWHQCDKCHEYVRFEQMFTGYIKAWKNVYGRKIYMCQKCFPTRNLAESYLAEQGAIVREKHYRKPPIASTMFPHAFKLPIPPGAI